MKIKEQKKQNGNGNKNENKNENENGETEMREALKGISSIVYCAVLCCVGWGGVGWAT